MPEDRLDPYDALGIIRTFAQVAVENDKPSLLAYEQILWEILKACDLALPTKGRRAPRAKPDAS